MPEEIKYSDNQESVELKEKRIVITKSVEVVENTSLRDLEQQLLDIEREQQFLDQRRSELKLKINSIGTELLIDVEKEIPKMKPSEDLELVKP